MNDDKAATSDEFTVGAEPQATAGTPIATVPSGSPAPVGQSMGQVAPQEPPKKKKTGLIVGLIIAAVVLIGGAIAAAIAIPMLSKKDPVTMAMGKIMSGDVPSNVAIDGDIDIAINDPDSLLSNITISLNSGVAIDSLANNSSATVTATVRNIGDVTVEISEVYAAGGDLFFKIDGVTDALEDSGLLYLLNLANQMPDVIDCGEDEYCQADELIDAYCDEKEDCYIEDIMTVEDEILADGGQAVFDENTIAFFKTMADEIELIDGEWLRISMNELGSKINSMEPSDASCIVDLISDINTNSNSAMELYEKNPFIKSIDGGAALKSKRYPVYRVSIDSENFAGFVNSIQNVAMLDDIYTCLNLDNNVQIDANDAAQIAQDLPEFYAEVDDEYNFTRLYLVSVIDSEDIVVTMDLNFNYPANINVSEPLEYQDYSKIIQDISTSLYEIEIEDLVDN